MRIAVAQAVADGQLMLSHFGQHGSDRYDRNFATIEGSLNTSREQAFKQHVHLVGYPDSDRFAPSWILSIVA
jgi:hypothetical protein